MSKPRSTFLYFNGTARLTRVRDMPNDIFAERWPGVAGVPFDRRSMYVGRAPDGSMLPVQRRIEYSGTPSLHACDARCLNATGRKMRCECSCGGVNHGLGSLLK